MKSACIPFDEIPQTSRLFSAFLSEPARLAAYYAHPPSEEGIAAAVRALNFPPASRRLLAEILRDQNARFSSGGKLDAAAQRSLDHFASGASAVVTGQQVGLFTGPAYTVYKALSALRCAQEASRRGNDAVPVFWLATEDHDLAEINQTWFSTRNGLVQFQLPAASASSGSVGLIPLGDAIAPLVESAVQSLEGPAASDVARALRESYAPGETFGSAFARLLARLFAGRGLLILDPQDPRLDPLAAPVYRAAIESAAPLREALLARSRDLESAGFHAQVHVAADSSLLFLDLDGRREPLRAHADGSFAASSAVFSKSALLAALENSPERFTASALLRPVLQDTFLPTVACIGGPAEVAYYAQSQVVYRALGARMPAAFARASFSLVEPPIARFLDLYRLDLRDVLCGRQHLRARLEQQALPGELTQKFAGDESALRALLDSYRAPLERLDATLLGSVDTTADKILGHFLKLKEKVGRAENFRTGVLDRHERILLDSLYPHHDLQERRLCFLPHLAAHGPQLLDDLSRLTADPASSADSLCARQHHVLFLD